MRRAGDTGHRDCPASRERRPRTMPGRCQRPMSHPDTQETREIAGWNPQIRLPLCLDGYNDSLSQAQIRRPDATGPGPRIGRLQCAHGGMWRQQRCVVVIFRWVVHGKGLDIGIPGLPEQAWRHLAEGGEWWWASLWWIQRNAPIRRGSPSWGRWKSSVWSRRLWRQLQVPEGHPGVRKSPAQGRGWWSRREQHGVRLLSELHDAARSHYRELQPRIIQHHGDHHRHDQFRLPSGCRCVQVVAPFRRRSAVDWRRRLVGRWPAPTLLINLRRDPSHAIGHS